MFKFKQIKLAALGLITASAILPAASTVNAALSRTSQQSIAEIQLETPKEQLVTRRYRRYRRKVRYRRRPRRRYRRVYRRRYRRPVRVYRRRTCYYTRYRRVCRYRTYRRY